MLGDQILIDPLGREAFPTPVQDSLPIRFAKAAGPGGRFGQNCWFRFVVFGRRFDMTDR